MRGIQLHRIQGILTSILALVALLFITACTGTATTTGPSTAGATATTSSATQVPTTTTQAPTATPPPATQVPTAAPVAFKAGGISFIGPVKSINNNSLVMSAPDGQIFTMAITAQTDRSAYGGNLPSVGASVDMDSAANPDGSYTATILKPARPGDVDLNVIAYTGITTSAVGGDRVVHLTVGTKSYTFTVPPTADVSEFGGNLQSIGNNVTVEVKIQFPAKTVVRVGNPNAP